MVLIDPVMDGGGTRRSIRTGTRKMFMPFVIIMSIAELRLLVGDFLQYNILLRQTCSYRTAIRLDPQKESEISHLLGHV